MNRNKLDQYSEILEKALALGKQKHPDAPPAHHAAFANSVACFYTGASGGYGGPSCREHAAERVGGAIAPMGSWEFEEAADFCDRWCYGEITDLHYIMFQSESCFDDAEEDIEVLRRFRTTTS